MAKQHQESFSEDEAQRRFEAALKGALKTPPKPHKDSAVKRPKEKSPARKPGSKD